MFKICKTPKDRKIVFAEYLRRISNKLRYNLFLNRTFVENFKTDDIFEVISL